MALDKAKLKSDIKAAFMDAKSKEEGPDAVFDALAGKISEAIDGYVKQIGITYSQGLTAPNGSVAGVFNYTIT